MISERDELRHQSEEHPLVPTTDFPSLETYVLYLVHRVAYEEAARRANGAAVLDIGCNNGYGTVIISKDSRSTVGVDVSPTAVESAQRFNARDNVQYQVIDGLRLPFDDGSFDLVTSFQVIEHISNVERYLTEIRRVLKPGGSALLTTPNRCIRLDPGMKPWNEFHVREYRADELRELLRTFFSDVEVRGLFAEPAVYDIEYARAQRALEDWRQKLALESDGSRTANKSFKETVKTLLPPPVLEMLRRMRGPSDDVASKLPPEVLARYSSNDFWYSDGDIDRALDLLAVCS